MAVTSIVAWEGLQAAHRAPRERYSCSAACLYRRLPGRLLPTGSGILERTGTAPLALRGHPHSSSSRIHHKQDRTDCGNWVHQSTHLATFTGDGIAPVGGRSQYDPVLARSRLPQYDSSIYGGRLRDEAAGTLKKPYNP